MRLAVWPVACLALTACHALLPFGAGSGDRASTPAVDGTSRGEGNGKDRPVGPVDHAPGSEASGPSGDGVKSDGSRSDHRADGPRSDTSRSDTWRSDGPRIDQPHDIRPPDGQTLQVPTVQWVTPLLGGDTVAPTAIAADPISGELFVTGGFTKDLSFKGTKYSAPGATSDGFLAGFQASGVPDWFQQVFSSASEDKATDVLFSGGRAWAAGYQLVTSFEARLVGFPPSGVGPIGDQSSGSGSERALAVAVDPASGDLLLGGSVQGAASFGGKVLPGGVGAGDGFVVRYAPDLGLVRWVQRVAVTNTAGSAEVRALTVEASGVINAFGHYTGTLAGCPASTAKDLFAVRLSSTGTLVSCQRFGSAGNDELIGAAGMGNEACFAGALGGAANIGGAGAGSIGSGFVACFSGGLYHWWKAFGGGGANAAGRGVALDGSGNVYLGGAYSSSINLGGPTGAPLPAPVGTMDGFVASFAPGGQHRWSLRVGGTGFDLVEAVTARATDDVVAAGQFSGALSGFTCPAVCGYVVQLK